MRVIGVIADRMLSAVAPKTTAGALCYKGWIEVNCYCKLVNSIEMQYKKQCWQNSLCQLSLCGSCSAKCECGSC